MSTSLHLPRLAGVLLALSAATLVHAKEKSDPLLERGKYLVHRAALCIDCHSPRDEKGQFVETKHLSGSVLGFAATVPMPWAPAAPSLIGLTGYTNDQAVKFLMTGVRPSGAPPLPPMPAYRFDEKDAKAIVAYLKSLKPVETVAAVTK